MNNLNGEFHDPMSPPNTSGKADRFFDRFMFNMHPADHNAPSIITGFGHYPGRNVADGYSIISLPNEQRNLRFSTELNSTNGDGAGPLKFECIEPNKSWRLSLSTNPTGMEYDVIWTARTPYWLDVVKVENSGATPTNFEHLVQSGRYQGVLSIDGEQQSVDGWYGQRDRSRGVRTMSGGQGLHIWFQAQFEDRSVGFLLVESRQGDRILLEGAIMPEEGPLDNIIDVQHSLVFDNLNLASGTVNIVTSSGQHYTITADASASGGFMSGAGYGGHHGKPQGIDHIESDTYPLDDTVNQRTLDTSLTDRLCRFEWSGNTGYGIFEFALSRSSSYKYSSTLS